MKQRWQMSLGALGYEVHVPGRVLPLSGTLCRPQAYECALRLPLQVLSGAGTMHAEHDADVAQMARALAS